MGRSTVPSPALPSSAKLALTRPATASRNGAETTMPPRRACSDVRCSGRRATPSPASSRRRPRRKTTALSAGCRNWRRPRLAGTRWPRQAPGRRSGLPAHRRRPARPGVRRDAPRRVRGVRRGAAPAAPPSFLRASPLRRNHRPRLRKIAAMRRAARIMEHAPQSEPAFRCPLQLVWDSAGRGAI